MCIYSGLSIAKYIVTSLVLSLNESDVWCAKSHPIFNNYYILHHLISSTTYPATYICRATQSLCTVRFFLYSLMLYSSSGVYIIS